METKEKCEKYKDRELLLKVKLTIANEKQNKQKQTKVANNHFTLNESPSHKKSR